MLSVAIGTDFQEFVIRELGTPRRVLDVGCGSGRLCRALVARGVPVVVGIDAHPPSIDYALVAGAGPTYVCGDFLTEPWPAASFDGIVAEASLHHMDLTAALRRVETLLAPGGRFVAVGLAQRVWRELPLDGVALVARRLASRLPDNDGPRLLVWPPPLDYDQVRAIATEQLRGVRYRRHLMSRFSLAWTKPA